MKKLLTRLPAWTLTITVSLVILYLTLVPRPIPAEMVPMFPGADKIVHGIMFGALAGAIVLDRFRRYGCGRARVFTALAALIAFVAGGVIELLQGAMDMGRGREVMDLVADGIGAWLGAVLAAAIGNKMFCNK